MIKQVSILSIFLLLISCSKNPVGPDNPPKGMVYVKGGTFIMGDIWGGGTFNETPTHEVTVSSFYIGKYEVSHAEYIKFLNILNLPSDGFYNGNKIIGINDKDCAISHNGLLFHFDSSYYANDEQCPVTFVTWYGACEYCNWLSQKEGLEEAYTISSDSVKCDWEANGYRLPTEAEWEYAARSGGRDDRKWSGTNIESDLDNFCWYASTTDIDEDGRGDKSFPVGTKQPNDLGIYDMSGNVLEWCWDWCVPYPSSSQTNPRGPDSGNYRVWRSSNWRDNACDCRTTSRNGRPPLLSIKSLGFRIARPK
ncbi:MAG TPA: formylglycine-generating enzyme family protein [bacterium]|nr:formylglycine-generating enzyme family protein [bacterium]